jgi:hypothetical protein
MDMALLFLARLKTIDITEEALRLKQVVLLHLVAGELLEVGKCHDLHHK